MKPSTKALLAVMAVALPALFNFFAAKVASDEAKIRAEVAYVTMQEIVTELQEASYTQALQIARLEGQQKCATVTAAPPPAAATKPRVGSAAPIRPVEPLVSMMPAPIPDAGQPISDGDGIADDSAPSPTAKMPHVGKVRPRDFQQAVQEYKAKK